MVRFKVAMPKSLWRRLDRNTRGSIGSANALLNEIVRLYLMQYENRDYARRDNLGKKPETRIVIMSEDQRRAIDSKAGNSREGRDSFIVSAVSGYFTAYG